MTKKSDTTFEQQLFKAADKLRKNIDAAEYKYVVLGLVFIKYISETFNELYEKLEADEYSDPEDRDEYLAENVFFVPEISRWSHIHNNAKIPSVGETIDEAMEAIEKENKELKNVLPKVYGKANLDKASLGQLIDLISNTELQAENEKSKDLFGRVYEYFLGEFANAEGKKGGQFYTPKAIVKLMVEMIKPYEGRVYDPACGSGGMFIMSEKFVTEHQGNINDITVYGQESNQTTWKLSKMNLAIRNINSQFVSWNTEGSFLKDAHPDLKAHFILANPPFNQKDWGRDTLQDDARWKYGTPPNGNANYAWIMHMLYHLAPKGVIGTVLSNGSLSSTEGGEDKMRMKLITDDLVECIVALPNKLFYNSQISACIWYLRKEKSERKNEVLFIDASKMGYMKSRKHRDLHDYEINKISETYDNWKKNKNYEDIIGYCKSSTLEDIKNKKYVISPGRYVGVALKDDDKISFNDKMILLNDFLKENTKNSREQDRKILNLLNTHFSNYKWENIDFSSNEILEYLSETIFNNWFRKYQLSNQLPEGWKNSTLKKVVLNANTGADAIQRAPIVDHDTGIKCIRIGDLSKNNSYVKWGFTDVTDEIFKKYQLKKDDIVVTRTSILGLNKIMMHDLNAVYNNGLIKVTINKDIIDPVFVYAFFRSQFYKDYIQMIYNDSSTRPNMKIEYLLDFPIIIPTKESEIKFTELYREILVKMSNNKKQQELLMSKKEMILKQEKYLNIIT